jgi:tRNA1(Val) A37 N6-methylase TrmN6
VPQCRVIGLELQRDLVRLAVENAALNGMSARVSLIAGDLLRPPPRLSPGMFDHVMANPPYIERGRGTPAASPAKAMATVRGKGTVSFVHRADRIDALIGHLAGRAGDIAIFPLWPMAGRPASRILVRATTQVATPARLLPGLILHEADGRFSGAAEAVLRGAAALAL